MQGKYAIKVSNKHFKNYSAKIGNVVERLGKDSGDYLNQRDDEYGGSVENRMRLMLETITAVRSYVDKYFLVGIRISQGKVSDFAHKWTHGEKEAEIIFSRLASTALNYIHVTEYDASKVAFLKNKLTLSALAKKYAKIPVISNGGLENPHKAEHMLTSGQADLISLGKGALTNHDWPHRVLNKLPLNNFNDAVLKPIANIKKEEIT